MKRLPTNTYAPYPTYQQECGSCMACCGPWSAFTVTDVKRCGEACEHLDGVIGCSVYEDKPTPCSQWSCLWRAGLMGASDSARPDVCGVLVDPGNEVAQRESIREAVERLAGTIPDGTPIWPLRLQTVGLSAYLEGGANVALDAIRSISSHRPDIVFVLAMSTPVFGDAPCIDLVSVLIGGEWVSP